MGCGKYYHIYIYRMNETFVRERKNFTIECDLKDANILECDNVEPATLPGKTTCEINGETEPKPCKCSTYIYYACLL